LAATRIHARWEAHSSDVDVEWTGLSANGTNNVTTTTLLTLTFDGNPGAVVLGNISISGGITASNLQGTDNSRTVNIAGNWTNGQSVTVTLTNPDGVIIAPFTRDITLHREAPQIDDNGDNDDDGDDNDNDNDDNNNDNNDGNDNDNNNNGNNTPQPTPTPRPPSGAPGQPGPPGPPGEPGPPGDPGSPGTQVLGEGSPQTGDDRTTTIFIIMIAIGLLLMFTPYVLAFGCKRTKSN